MTKAVVIDVSSWPEREENPEEQLGARGGTWLVKPAGDGSEGRLWIFKPVRPQTVVNADQLPWFEEDWAEYVAARVGQLLGLPVAPIDLALRGDERGVISPNFIPDPAHPRMYGNELLFRANPDYPLKGTRQVLGYTPERCMELLAGFRPPLGASSSSFEDAADAFAGYLLLDAVVANTDRHHENWCLVQYDGGSHLAPCYDLGTCLGFQLTDTRRREAFETADRNRTITAWCKRGRSGTFEGRPPLVDVAVKAVRLASDDARATLRDRLAGLDEERIAAVLAGVPDDRMSQWAGRFALNVILTNRDRLLDVLP